MINFALRLFGFGKAVDALDGETSKAYIGGLGLILTGGSTILGGAAALLAEVLPLHGADAYVHFAQAVPHDANIGLVIAGAALISKGIAEIGQRHATAVLSNDVAEAVKAPDPLVTVK